MYRRFLVIVMIISFTGLTSMTFNKGIKGTVVCFGDSITHGAQVDGHSWVWWLQNERHRGVSFVNAGRNGRKTADKKELLPVLKKYPAANYYLIFLGVNDLKDGTPAMVNQCVENMQWMVDTIHATDPVAKIVLLAPCDINVKTMSPLNVGKKYNMNTHRSLVLLEERYKALAKAEHLGFISLLHAVSKPDYADGLHPNIKGQQQIASAVWQGLNKLY